MKQMSTMEGTHGLVRRKPVLTLKQQRFVEEYIATGNGVESARRAGYKGNTNTLAVVAAENLMKPNIALAVSKRTEKALQRKRITADGVLNELADIAASDWRDHLQITCKDGEVVGAQLKLGDKIKSLELLAKHYGLFQADKPNEANVKREIYGRVLEYFRNFVTSAGEKLPEALALEGLLQIHPDAREVLPEVFAEGSENG